ncbi:MAG: ribose-phosphate pyrophosphokinase [Burkholderiales bacterium]|nr:ribose-phosphate pyrophosphokinase [Burkholderiales bacterium]
MALEDLRLFGLDDTRAFGEAVARALGVALARHEERDFEDGEHKTRPLENVRGKDVFVVQALYGEPGRTVNDKLVKLLFFLGCLKDAGAGRLTAAIPYLAYARKDRKTQTRDPVTTRYVAALVEAVGTDRVLALDVHNPAAFQNAFRCGTDHLEARPLFARHAAQLIGAEDAAVVSPDTGGAKRAEALRATLGQLLGRPVANAFAEKYRARGEVTGELLVGDVKGRVALIVDDLISTGGTILRAARACRNAGAKAVHALATHGLFMGGAAEMFAEPALAQVIVTNSVPPLNVDRAALGSKLAVLDVAPLFADAIRRSHTGGSLVELLEP